MNKEERIDLGDGYMLIEAQDYYSILTPMSSMILPKNKFRAIIARFARKAMENPKDEGV